jgi:putative membrane protein insertion efficiency factor
MLRTIEWYQRGAEGRPSPCRFFPSCSEYGHEAITAYGAGRGGWLTLRRLLRCRPFGPSGFDPLPPVDAATATPLVDRPHADHPAECSHQPEET